ncbi:MAG: hypothetical protein AAGI54_10290 [Planctomycetota bacterium]
MHTPITPSPLMRVVRSPLGRYQLQVGLASLDLGPGELKKLHRLLKTAVDDYATALAEDACGVDMSDRQAPQEPGNRSADSVDPDNDPDNDPDETEG